MDRIKNLLGKRTTTILSAAAKDVVRAAAPNLGNAIGGPLGGVVEREIARAVTGKPDAPSAEVSARIEAGDAETMAKLYEAQAKLEAVGVDLAKVEAEDRADARAAHAGSWHVIVVAGSIMVAFFAMLGGLMFVQIPEGNREVVYALAGTMLSLVMMVGHFFFGSSEGSKQKTGILAKGASR
ncbi:hypothetical protein ATO8_18615 [Roseivivax marinus]|uniref:Transmembrane protein n=1 Tax=Roseivivax marinus TaxID=1379903 RepID=W4HGR5_9RHOB|nr:hypothetical protein [Roseivivax marinus]ETW11195.1 hypothetical protein ATO8_18615 [Roseivivax marinus]